ncbi:transposase domain-containing protein [Amphritea sp. 2_MG-2023]
METATANQQALYRYLRYVFEQLPKANSVDQIKALLPWDVTLQDAVN